MNFNEILYGVAYYDEYMPYDRIETDFKMIRDAGMNVIRIAESTWSTWEPKEGVFDFTHLHRMLDCAAKYELKVIVGTPTYAVPSWLAKKYPDKVTSVAANKANRLRTDFLFHSILDGGEIPTKLIQEDLNIFGTR